MHPQLARAQGDFLLVGLHADEAVAERRGAHLPIMDLHERSLSVLACRYVNEVILGAHDDLCSYNPLLPAPGGALATEVGPEVLQPYELLEAPGEVADVAGM